MTATAGSVLTDARRLVIKVGSSSLTSADGGLDTSAVEGLVAAVMRLRTAGTQVVVVSSGAIAAGLAPLGLTARPSDLATQQAAASVGQGLLVRQYTESFARHDTVVGQVLLTVDDVVRRSQWRIVAVQVVLFGACVALGVWWLYPLFWLLAVLCL